LWYLWFDKGSCTDYASSRRPELFMKKGKRLITGNAKERLWKAQKMWISTSNIPKKWSIAVYSPWADDAGEYGHVAYVEEVWANGVIVVSDMNYKGEYILTRRTVKADVADWYIY
jgi:surface antigen